MRYLLFVYPDGSTEHNGWASFEDAADTWEELDDIFASVPFESRMKTYQVAGEYTVLRYEVVDLHLREIIEVGTVTIDPRGRITVDIAE